MNKLVIITTNASALLQSHALAMHSFLNGAAESLRFFRTQRRDDVNFHVRNCYQIQASSYFIGVLQTVRDLAKNARNHFILL